MLIADGQNEFLNKFILHLDFLNPITDGNTSNSEKKDIAHLFLKTNAKEEEDGSRAGQNT